MPNKRNPDVIELMRATHASVSAARSEIEQVAAEAAQEMVRRVAGLTVDSKDAANAVKAELNV